MKNVKIFGFVLVFLGVGIILFSLYSSFNIFTGVNLAPEIFPLEQQVTGLDEKQTVSLLDIQGQMEQIMKEEMGKQLQSMFPPNFMASMLNLTAWSILSGILIFGGAQIAGVGSKLLRA